MLVGAACAPTAKWVWQRPLIEHADELERYPTFTKQQITANYQDMIAVLWRGKTLSKVTGGSTGDPFRFEYTMDVYARRTAVMWRGYGWGGAALGARTAYLRGTGLRSGGWGGFKDQAYHRAFNRHFFDAFNLSSENIDHRIDEVLAHRPNAVVDYVAPLAVVARWMVETGRIAQGIRGVLTGAEALYEPERASIHQALGCPTAATCPASCSCGPCSTGPTSSNGGWCRPLPMSSSFGASWLGPGARRSATFWRRRSRRSVAIRCESESSRSMRLR